jgi:hypothetical protein
VLFVVVRGVGGRFVSKKVAKVKKPSIMEIGNRWQKHGKDRIYFESATISKLLGLSNSQGRKIAGDKFWYDKEDGKFYSQTNHNSVVSGWSSKIRESYEVPATNDAAAKPFPNAMLTSTGQWVTPDQWDEIEGSM